MSAKKVFITQIKIPEGIQADVVDNTIKIKGPKGELKRTFLNPRVVISKDSDNFMFKTKDTIKYSAIDKMHMNTYKAHIKNMFIGVKEAYTAQLKICSGHFPMNVSVEGNNLVVKNFLGEKIPRKANIPQGVVVKVQGDLINVEGNDKEKVGQAAATIEQSTRITRRDRRVFQDGCFIIKKPGDKDE